MKYIFIYNIFIYKKYTNYKIYNENIQTIKIYNENINPSAYEIYIYI
jgi:hypothetical protein